MAGATISTYEEVHRELWPEQRVEQELYGDCPSLGLIRKDTSAGYKKTHVALQYGRPQGRSRVLATAIANVSSSEFEDFEIDTVDDYGVMELSGKLIRSSKSPDAAFIVNVLERETNGAMDTVRRSLCINAVGDGTGVRGRLASSSAISEGGGESVLTLASPSDIKNFEVGMQINAAATTGGALRDSGAAYEVVGIDLVNGEVTVTGTAATTSSWANGDYLFAEGDAAAGSGSLPMVAGFRAWIPDTDPTSAPFFNVDRSAYPNHLAGWRFSATGLGTSTIRETILKSLSVMTRMGPTMKKNKPDTLLMNGEDIGDFLAELGAAGLDHETIQRKGNDVEIFYEGIGVWTPLGKIMVFHEDQLPKGRAMAINPDTWTLHSIGPAPRFVEEDGLRFLRKSGSDDFQGRLVYHANMSCDAPLYNANIDLT